MRIIGGELGGRIIKMPKFFTDRPTTDIAKEALFNILNNTYDFENLTILDTFSGSGSISYEFASRGTKKIISIEKNKKYCEFIRETSKMFFPENNPITVINSDVFRFLQNTLLDYDIIFADPPYDLPNINLIPEIVFSNKGKKEGIWLIIEHSADNDFSEFQNFKRKKSYGKVNFSFFYL